MAFGAGERDLARGVGSAGYALPGPLPQVSASSAAKEASNDHLREEIRRVIAEELRLALKG